MMLVSKTTRIMQRDAVGRRAALRQSRRQFPPRPSSLLKALQQRVSVLGSEKAATGQLVVGRQHVCDLMSGREAFS